LTTLRKAMQTLLLAMAVGAGVLAAPSAASADHVVPPTTRCDTAALPGVGTGDAGPPSTGWFYCDYSPFLLIWPDGHPQYFVIGGGYAVYDSFRRADGSWSAWRNLGGVARSGVLLHPSTALPSRLVIRVTGTNHTVYCKPWVSGDGWSGWRPCSQL
jgi:opacity protein-like surface antigen